MAALGLELLRQAYAGRRVLVTGHTGFKGSWLSVALMELGAEVHGFALPPRGPEDMFPLLGLERVVRHHVGDVRDPTALLEVVRACRPEIVFHLAAQALVRRSYDDPVETFHTNVTGSVNVLEAVRRSDSTRALVYVTSDKCYRNKEWVWGYRETDELGGDDPYSASKAAAELVFASYAASYFRDRAGLGAASARAGNVIGGGDWSMDRIVPDCVRALRAGRPIVLRNPSSTRPWQHVLEPVFGYLLLGARLAGDPGRFSGSWNFGPRAEATRTVRDLAAGIVARWGTGAIEEEPTTGKPEAGLLRLNCDRARDLLGWEAVWTFEESVDATVEWYRRAPEGDALAVTRHQIRRYLEAAR